jgi:hypothetical protein
MNGLTQKSHGRIVADNRRLRAATLGEEYRVTILSNVKENALMPWNGFS